MKTNYILKFYLDGENKFTTSIEAESYDQACNEAIIIMAKTKIYNSYEVRCC